MTTNWAVARILRDRNAGLYFTGVVVSAFGTSALGLAAGVWVKDLSGSNGLAALCVFAVWAPTLGGPVLGTIADRVRRKPLLIRTNLALAALLLTLFTVDSRADLWLLFTVLFVYGAVMVVQDPAESALVTAVVDRDLLGDFNGLRMSAVEGMKLVAPLTGAGLYTAFGGPAVACLDAVTIVLAAGLWLFVRVREERPRRPAGDWRAQTAEGVRELWGSPRLRPLVLASGTMMFLASLSSSSNYAIVEGLGHAPAYTGVLYAVQGVGSVSVGLVSGPALRRLGERRFGAAGIVAAAAGVAARAVPSDPVVLVGNAAIGLGLPCVLIAAFTAVQREVPGALLGRATATANTLIFTPNVIGLAAGAALVELVDYRGLLIATGLALLTTGAALALLATAPPATGSTTTTTSSGSCRRCRPAGRRCPRRCCPGRCRRRDYRRANRGQT
ncbi:MFS transporter [Streptomyces sp. NPDC002276]